MHWRMFLSSYKEFVFLPLNISSINNLKKDIPFDF